MKYISYLRKSREKQGFCTSLLLPGLLGLIPAVLLPARSGMIDSAIEKSDLFFWWCLWFLALSLGQSILTGMQQWLTHRHSIAAARNLEEQRLKKVHRIRFPITETETFHRLFHEAAKAGEAEETCCNAWQTLVLVSVQMISTMLLLFCIDLPTAAGLCLLLICGISVHIRAAKEIPGFWSRYMENMRRTNYFATLLLYREYAAERKVFGWDEEISRRFSQSFQQARKENQQLGRTRFKADGLLEVFSALYAVLAALLLMRPLLRGTLTAGLFTSAFYAANTLRAQIGQICGSVYTLKSSFSQIESYEAFMALEETPAVSSEFSAEAPEIVFSHVNFTYPGQDKPVLWDLNFTLEPGRHYALVGENGSGKSTLVKLLAGLYQPDSGEITVGGIPLNLFSESEKRNLFSLVFQDFYRYPLTLRENLSLGQEVPFEDSEIRPVLEALDFNPSILARGLDADLLPLQKEGSGLSGGEWQKLAIARCILSQAALAILDEPNASLDPIGEAQVYQAYQHLLKDRTTLFISHRLGSVKQADSILVLRQGRLLAQGSHDELMENCPYYHTLFMTQRGLYHEN